MTLDLRRIVIEIEVNNQIRTYEDLYIVVSGEKFINGLVPTATIQIANLEREVVNSILADTTPFSPNRGRKRITVRVGRRSNTRLATVFNGGMFRATVSQPPDKVLTIYAMAGVFEQGEILTRSLQGPIQLRQLAGLIAQDLSTTDNPITLNFQASDQTIAGNYWYSGSSFGQVNKLTEFRDVGAFVDLGKLNVVNITVGISNRIRRVSAENGMIGVPEFTEDGVQITFLWDPQTSVGDLLIVTSEINPSLSGTYVIARLNYILTTREIPFYYIARAIRFRASS